MKVSPSLRKLSVILAAVLLVLTCMSSLCQTVTADDGASESAEADALPDVDAPAYLTDDEHDTGYMTVDFAKNGVDGSPYTSGLNTPVGYYFNLDSSKKLTQISITDFATYSNNVNKGVYALYQWQGDYTKTVKSTPLVKINLVNAQDHQDLVMDVPAELNVTGELYFEVYATEGSGYTPWIARDGVASEVPGVVTGMQAYQKGNISHAFACMISVIDMVNQSPAKFVNWTYDFGQDLTNPDGKIFITHKNQISIGAAHDGYTTFTAEGDDPYFRIPDEESPTQSASELAYVAILYRTSSDMDECEFFTNHGGATWGGAGTHATADLVTDGLWHVTLADASESWGTDTDNTLFAFRFDPLSSGCDSGDTCDVAWLKFFGDGDKARAYVEEMNQKLNDARSAAQEAGTHKMCFTNGKLPEGCTVSDDATVYVTSDFTRLSVGQDNTATVSLEGLAGEGFTYARVIYRSEGTETVTLKADTASDTADTVCDGFWAEADLNLGDYTDDRLNLTFTAADGDAWADLAAVILCNENSYRDAYVFDGTLNNHLFVLGDTPVPVLTCTIAECGDPYCGPGEYYGQKFVTDTPVYGVIVYNNSTWQDGNNKGTFRLWKWKGNYEDTVASEPLYTEKLTNLANNCDLDVRFDKAYEAGEYLFEVKMENSENNAYTGFSSKGGQALPGCVSYRNGVDNGTPLYTAYLTMGKGLTDMGEEYTMNPTAVFDFTRHYDSVKTSLGLGGFSGCDVTDLCDKGYMTVTNTSNDPYFTLESFPETQGSLCDWIVIRYRTETTAEHGEFFVCRDDGVTWGQDYANSNVLFDWEADGEWHVAVIDATNVWGNAGLVKISNLRFDPLEKPTESGETIDIASIHFFANSRAATAYADSLYEEKNGERYVSAPRVPLTPDQVNPVLVIDGENLTPVGGNQMTGSLYDYSEGCVTLYAKGEDPNFYLFSSPTDVAPYVLIRYRTTASGVGGEIYAGSDGTTATGKGDKLSFSYTPDGQWHNAVLDLSELTAYNEKTDNLGYFRYDFVTAGSGPVRTGMKVELECVAFFKTEDEALAFEHSLPVEAMTYTVRFYAEGHYITSVTYKEGAATIDEPVVPKKPGMTGTWEAYKLEGDVDVNAVWTPINPEEPVTLPVEETEPPTDGADTAPDTELESDVSDVENEPEVSGEGCASVMSLSVLLVLLCGLAAFRRRHE